MNDIPIGFFMALSENERAMNRFGTLSGNAREKIVAQARAANSHEQMQAVVNTLAQGRQMDG